jgi:hypothetical protein
MSFAPRASTAHLPEPFCASWLITSLTCVPADVRRPSAAVLHLPRDSDIGKVQSVRVDLAPFHGIDWPSEHDAG